MDLHVNGESINVPASVGTISELIQHFGIENPVVIVEHNDEILEKKNHDSTEVAAGDKIELIQFLGGG